jgi:hypothetical protein
VDSDGAYVGGNLKVSGLAYIDGNQTVDTYSNALTVNNSLARPVGGYFKSNTNLAGAGYALVGSNTNGGIGVAGFTAGGTGGYGGYFGASTVGIALRASGQLGATALSILGPMTIDNSTLVTNLNAEKLGGNTASAFLAVGATAADSDKLDGSHAVTFVSSVVGNTGTATTAGSGGVNLQMGTGLAPTYEVACSSNNIILQTASDRTLKQDIVDETHGLSTLLALRPRKFRFISDPEFQQHGFIAQEVALIATPNGEKDALAFTRGDGIMGINHLSLIGIVVKGIQELEARVRAIGG